LNALTGKDFIPSENKEHFPSELSIPIVTKRILKLSVEEPDERTHIVALIDEELKARLIYHFYGNDLDLIKFALITIINFFFPK